MAKREKLYASVRETAGRLLDEVKDRMPDKAVIRSFLCYDARDLPEGPLPSDYGEADIELQIAYFAPESMGKSLWLIEPAKLRDQWATFKRVSLTAPWDDVPRD